MKKITISTDYASYLNEKIGAFRTDKNKVFFEIGTADAGDGLICSARIVGGGNQGNILFKTQGKPKDYVANEVYASFAVGAAEFCNSISKLVNYKSDIAIKITDKSLYLVVSGVAEVPLLYVEAGEVEAPILTKIENVLCRFQLSRAEFMRMLRTGGFLSTPDADTECLTDRVVFRMQDVAMCTYSTDRFFFAKSWGTISNVNYDNSLLSSLYLVTKGEKLDANGREVLAKKLSELANSPDELVAYAKSEGFTENEYSFALPCVSCRLIRNLFEKSSEADLFVTVTAKNVIVQSNTVMVISTLYRQFSAVFGTKLETFEKLSYDVNVVVDRDQLRTALDVISLGDSTKPFLLSFKSEAKSDKMRVVKGNYNLSVPLVAASGELSNICIAFNDKKVMGAISSLSGGNLHIRLMANKKMPAIISNGDFENNATNALVFLMPVATAQSSEEKEVKEETVEKAAEETAEE